jgi:hypothetical protein
VAKTDSLKGFKTLASVATTVEGLGCFSRDRIFADLSNDTLSAPLEALGLPVTPDLGSPVAQEDQRLKSRQNHFQHIDLLERKGENNKARGLANSWRQYVIERFCILLEQDGIKEAPL